MWLVLLCLVFGLGLISAAGWATGWNERQAVLQQRRAVLSSGLVYELDPARQEPAAEGRLVHATGRLVVPGTRLDRDFEVFASGVALLDRRVEMFQWQQEGSGPYTYKGVWSEKPIDSRAFSEKGHANPEFLRRELRIVAPRAAIGLLTISYDSIWQLGPAVPFVPTQASGAKLTPTGLYSGADPEHPAVGDLRVRYSIVRPDVVSVLGLLSQGTLRPFALEGRDLLVARTGTFSAVALAEVAPPVSSDVIWGLRGATAFGLLVGFWLLMQPAGALGDALERRRPLLADLVATGPLLIALALTVFSWALLAGVVWLRYRVLWGGAVVGAGLLLAGWMGWIVWTRWVFLQPVEYTPTRVREG